MIYRIYNVFGDGPVSGNPTGVVYFEGAVDTDMMQRIARDLALPDTLFIMPSENPGLLFTSLAFTPHQEISICGQGMIGGLYAWIEDHGLSDGSYKIGRRHGESIVRIADEPAAPVFVSMGRPTVTELDEGGKRVASEIAGSAESPRSAFIELGRKRLVVQVESEMLAQLHLEPSNVMDWCRGLGVTGIVLFSDEKRARSANWRSRHFTTSLLGAEDAVTGGASAAILAFCLHFKGVRRDATYLVHQGGFRTREGFIYVRLSQGSGEVFIGGSAVKTAEGILDA
jgi:PhzF family phenazine biosynthesis protein